MQLVVQHLILMLHECRQGCTGSPSSAAFGARHRPFESEIDTPDHYKKFMKLQMYVLRHHFLLRLVIFLQHSKFLTLAPGFTL